MEYLIGSIAALLAIYYGNKILNKTEDQNPANYIKYSQSHIYELVKDIIPTNAEIEKMFPPKSQSWLHNQNQYLNVIIHDGKAYWIKENVFYTADFADGDIVKDTTKQVDTMSMNKVELDKIIFIVDKLTKGNGNEDSDSGNS